MANATKTNIKFGVVHTSPTKLITNAASLEDGKLYFAAGDASGLVKQGIYGVVGVTTDGSIDNDGDVNGKQLAMFGTGAVADGTGYGLSQYNFDDNALKKLNNLYEASSNYLLNSSYVQVSNSSDGYVPMADDSAGTISSPDNDWVLTFNGSNVDWYKLPQEAFKNDIYSGTSPIDVSGGNISHENSGVAAGRYGDIDDSTGRQLTFDGKFTVVDISVNKYGHVTNAVSRELILPSKPATAGTADMANEAKKTTGTLTFKVNGTYASAFNGSANTYIDISAGTNISISKESDDVIKISTSGVPTTTDMNNAINTALSSALQYKGTVNDASVLPPTGNKVGDVYVCSTLSSGKTYYEIKQNDVSVRCESGDLFIWNGTYFDIVNGENQVSDASATLTPGSTDLTLATVDGTDITVNVPALPSIVNTLNNKSGELTTQYDTSTFTSDSSYRAGTLTIADKTHIIYGKDTVYSHPASINGLTLADSSLKSTTATPLSHEGIFTVATGVYRDSSGHISKVETETFNLPAQYIHPVADTNTANTNTPIDSSTAATLLTRVKIDSSGHITDTTAFNGTVGGTTTPVYFKAGVPTALSYTIAKSVPSDASFTDKNVQDVPGTEKSFILGHTTQGSTTTATTDASVYMQSGKMYAETGDISTGETALVTAEAVKNAIGIVTIYWETL